MSESTELVLTDSTPIAQSSISREIAQLTSGTVDVFSSNRGTDHKSKISTINALTNATPLSENLNKEIKLKDVIVQFVDMADERSGEINSVPRLTLIDADGKAFHVMSSVVYKDLKTFFAILGMPHTWPAPLPIIAENGKAKVGKFLTLRLA